MKEILILFTSLIGALPLAYLILRLIFGKSVMVTMGWWVAILVFMCCEMFYIVGKYGFVHLYWAFPVMFIVGTSIFVYLNISIRNPLLRSVEYISELSKGHLADELKEKKVPKVELGLLYESIGVLRKNLITIVGEVQENSELLKKISYALGSGSANLKEGSSIQVSSLDEVSSTLEEFAVSIRESTASASRTQSITNVAHQKMSQVFDQTKKTVDANRTIAGKIKVINDIAVQINILALNATVEAARAGEAGRGFAVVAGEVSKLSETTRKAADEIVQLAQSTFLMSEEAGKMLEETLPEIDRANVVVREISEVGVEQQRGADEISAALRKLDEVARDIAVSSEMFAKNAKDMFDKANLLKLQVEFFKIEESLKGEGAV